MGSLTLGQRIAMRRKLSGISQEKLAEETNVSRQAVSKWELDAAVPEIDKLIALSKLFHVRIDWLVGLDSEENLQVPSPPRLFLSKHFKILTIIATCVIIATSILLFFHYENQIHVLEESNKNSSANIIALTSDNEKLKNQLTAMQEMMNQMSYTSQLLTNNFMLQASVDDALKNVSAKLFMKPKVYLEDRDAYLLVQNLCSGYDQIVKCTWDTYNQTYIADFNVPAVDGYQVSFILTNSYTYEEDNLLLHDPGFQYLGSYCTFHLDPTSLHHINMQQKNHSLLSITTLSSYSFNEPIYTPHIFTKTAVAYKDINIALLRNGEIIWKESYLDDFLNAAGGKYLNAGNTPVNPNVQIDLTKISEVGDMFELVLTAQTVNGGSTTQNYTTLLDCFKIVA